MVLLLDASKLSERNNEVCGEPKGKREKEKNKIDGRYAREKSFFGQFNYLNKITFFCFICEDFHESTENNFFFRGNIMSRKRISMIVTHFIFARLTRRRKYFTRIITTSIFIESLSTKLSNNQTKKLLQYVRNKLEARNLKEQHSHTIKIRKTQTFYLSPPPSQDRDPQERRSWSAPAVQRDSPRGIINKWFARARPLGNYETTRHSPRLRGT